MKLEGKVAIITGAGRGVGKSTALAYARDGAKLVLDARSQGEIDEVAAEIRSRGSMAIAVRIDIARTADSDHLARVEFGTFE